jgi:hypothetical protein
MTERRPGSSTRSDRDARLKAALKANIAKRKARAQALEPDPPSDRQQGEEPLAPSKED